MLAVDLQNLCKFCTNGPTIDSLSLQIEAGEMIALLGPPGAGKTTLLNLMSGLVVPDSGEIAIFGHRLPHELFQAHHLSGTVQQTMAFYEHLTVWDNLALFASLARIPRKKMALHILNALTQMQLLEHKQSLVYTFSAGMKRRLALACALLSNPPLLYLDELTSGIDVQERFVLWDYIRSLRILNKTYVIATSSFEEACTLCDRIALISCGRLLALDTPEQLKLCYGDIAIELELAHPLPSLTRLEALQGVKKVVQQASQLSIIALDSRQVLQPIISLVTQEHEIITLRVRALRLDEILPHFLSIR